MFKRVSPIIGCVVLVFVWWINSNPAEVETERVLAKKDISSYAGADMILTVRELEFPPAFNGTKHRHPGPVVVCVLEGSLEISLEGQLPDVQSRAMLLRGTAPTAYLFP